MFFFKPRNKIYVSLGMQCINPIMDGQEHSLLCHPHFLSHSFPGFNPTVYYISGVVNRDSGRHSHNLLAALRAAVCIQWQTFLTHITLLSELGFNNIVEIIIAAYGGLIEYHHQLRIFSLAQNVKMKKPVLSAEVLK